MCACLLSRALKTRKSLIIKIGFVYAVCESVMVLGYFLFETVFFGIGIALADVIGNLLQAVFGLVVGTALTSVVMKTRVINEYMK